MTANPAGLTVPEVRSRLERLASLPLRPQTARFLLGPEPHPNRPDPREWDPGWALVDLRAGSDPDVWLRLSGSSWWTPASETDLKPLWRHAVATALAALRIASERRLADPGILAKTALLHRLGDWAVSAVAPGLLSSFYTEPDLESRLALEVRWLGRPLQRLGEELADRWDVHADLRDAVWLVRDGRGTLNGCSENPERLGVLQEALRMVETTPFALDHPVVDEPRLSSPARRRLMAEVQARTSEPFTAPDASLFEETLARKHARLQIRHQRLEQKHNGLVELVRELSPEDPSPEALRSRWIGRDRRLERLEHQLRSAVDAHRHWLEEVEAHRQSDHLSALAQFAAGAGHELNNPLAVIMGRAQLLLARTRDADAERSLQTIIAQSRRAHRILRDLMYVARPPEPRPRPCQPSEVVRSCLKDLATEAEARGVRLVVEPSDPIGWSMSDPEPIRHLADVLVRNAIEATPSGGSVRVRWSSTEGMMTWEVHDSGRGLSDEEAARMLDPFFCGRQAGRGLGLGLTRLARSLQLCGGRLSWKTAPNRGTLFVASLPRVKLPEPGEDASAA